ncbi:WW domain binding protein VOPP1 isoform X3 [Sylvia atricapilla]|uniref:WW domain binding protein VOPP1 isoform X3 n=1 Tax=Sylvia atricapilla TaxID=48155 RepID=UPI0033948A1E
MRHQPRPRSSGTTALFRPGTARGGAGPLLFPPSAAAAAGLFLPPAPAPAVLRLAPTLLRSAPATRAAAEGIGGSARPRPPAGLARLPPRPQLLYPASPLCPRCGPLAAAPAGCLSPPCAAARSSAAVGDGAAGSARARLRRRGEPAAGGGGGKGGGEMKRFQPGVALLLSLLWECTDAKKHCWYFEGLYPTYYICRSYEDCCGSRCCVRALSIQRLWYFWFLLMMGVLFCCGAGFFIRRRMYPPPLVEEPTFNVSYTRQPVSTASGSPLNCIVPRREMIHLSFTLAYQQIQDTTK